jgi:cell division protein FtsB
MSDAEIAYRQSMNRVIAKKGLERVLLICVFLLACTSVGLLVNQNRELSAEIHNQQIASRQRSKNITNLESQIQKTSTDTQGYVLCIGQFFEQPNRTNETLDLNTCKINSQGKTVSSFLAPAGISSPVAKTPAAVVPTTPTEPPTKQPVATSPPPVLPSVPSTKTPVPLLNRILNGVTGLL